MAKFSQNTLNQIAGFDGQIIAQELIYDQKDFWNFAWESVDEYGTTTPVDLTGATISAQIIRRQITDFRDSRTGLDFNIYDYPLVPLITTVSVTTVSSNILICASTRNLFEDQPVKFGGSVFGNVVAGTTYYVKQIVSETSFTISATQGGSEFALATATGSMTVDRVSPTAINLPISNRNDANGTFTMTIDADTWAIIQGDPELDINADEPVCFSGRVKISFPANSPYPAYDEAVFLLFLITSDGVIN